ncbi:MAG: family 10 glycosylhydrolase [Candidatus Sumerlaeaceae bacterium]|nr:family 10 glycosylhydrolase [Candidatus Sumerlaeaceae bacterium]
MAQLLYRRLSLRRPCSLRVLIVSLAAIFLSSLVDQGHTAEYRMLWVDVFHPGLRTPSEIDTMISVARQANYNALIVQMRKACDAFYDSSVEPKNETLARDFDPLAHIIKKAHDTSGGKKPLEVHAWLVSYRCRIPGDNTWKNPRHVFQRHPEWLSETVSGAKEDRGENPGRYYLDPGVPAVVDYTMEVVRDLVSRYPLDGIHFDYIRYPESEGSGNVWGYNPVAVSRFNKLYGRSGKPAPNDPDWCEFRRRQIFHLVRRAYVEAHAIRPDIKVSAATIAWGNIGSDFSRTDAYARVFQDWPAMLQSGILDLAIPMNYKRESVASQAAAHRAWARFLAQTASEAQRFGVNGVDGETLNTLQDVLAQMKATRSIRGLAGLANYCYAETRKGSPNPPDTEFFEAIRTQIYQRWVAPPTPLWLTNPKTGIIAGRVTQNGRAVDGALVKLASGEETFTDGTGFFAFCKVSPGVATVEAVAGKTSTHQTTTVRPGAIAQISLNLQ